MRNFVFTLIFFICQFALVRAQNITIPDPNFVAFLQLNYPNCMNGNQLDTICPDILNETLLDLDGQSIADLDGIQYFDGLVELKCSHNVLSGLPNLPAGLISLTCGFNQIQSLPPLPGSLIQLSCDSNLIDSLPALPASLLDFSCNNNQLNYLPSLPPALASLYCRFNQITTLPLLPAGISVLNCGFNQLISLPSLPSALTILDCSNNLLTSLPPLPNGLTWLNCNSNELSTWPTLPLAFYRLECSFNQFTTLPPLTDTLAYLACEYNQLTFIPRVPNIMQLFLINNNAIQCVSNLPLVYNPFSANITGNQLSCVPNQTSYSNGLPLCLYDDTLNNPNNCFSLANISGNVYTDFNANCSPDSSDRQLWNIPVRLFDQQNNQVALTYAINGSYSFSLMQTDTFTVKVDDQMLPFSMDCGQPNHQVVNLDSVNQLVSGIHFPVLCDSVYDINVQSVSTQGWVFPGQIHALRMNITTLINHFYLNCNSVNYQGAVSVQVSGPVSYVSPTPGALTPTINGNVYSYQISDFNLLTLSSVGMDFMTDTTAQSGDPICVHIEISSNPTDADTTNNVYDFCYNVVNSYDPNMKEVYPVNVLPGYDDWFTYTIHFQNTGTAPAFNIRLRDTLDAQLDLNTFEVRGFSHPAVVSLNGNILNVRFNNIMLPDSTSDYEGSMGYFQYRIKPLQNLPLGTQIENTAYIYFDFNAPIITNTTRNEFLLPTSVQETPLNQKPVLFPNPGSGLFFFKDSRSVRSVEVFNMLGEKVLNLGAVNQINLEAQPKGMYMVRVNGTQMGRVVKE